MIKLNRDVFEEYLRNVLLFADVKNKDILTHLIDVVFVEKKNRPMKRYVLRNILSDILKRKIDKSIDRTIQEILDEGINSEKFVYNVIDETYNMSENEYSEVSIYMEHFLTLENNFRNGFLKFITEDSVSIDDIYLEDISEGIIDVTKNYLYGSGVAVFQKIMNLEDSVLIEDELKDVILKVYRQHNFDIYILAEIERLIKEYFMCINDEGVEYIIEVLKKTVFLRLYSNLNIKNNKDFLKERIFYIDTNILIPLIFSNHPQSNDVRGIIRKCREQSIKLKVTTITIDEYKRLFNYLKSIDRSFNEAGVYENRRFVKNLSKIKVDNEIYNYYLSSIGTYRNFADFTKEFCDNIYHYLNLYNIEEEKFNAEMLETLSASDEHKEFLNKLYDIKNDDKGYVSIKSVEHDLYMMEYINNVRTESNEIDELGHRIWFITLDKKLEIFRFNNRKYFNYPVTMTIDELYDLLLPFYIEKKNFTEDYIQHLIDSNIGLYDYNEDKFVNLNVLNCVFNNGIDIKQLNGLSDKEQLELIYAIQSNRNIKQICEQIGENDGNDIENKPENTKILEELKENLKEFVQQQVELLEERDTKSRMDELANELSKTKKENEELREFKKEYYSIVEQNKKKTETENSKKRALKMLYTFFYKIKQLFKKFCFFKSTNEK